jgi:hypothetical protein
MSLIPGCGGAWDRRVMKPHSNRTSPGHAFSVPVVRELPPRPLPRAATW